ncbi:lysine--tRNA ligase [Roseibaca sp. V10]|uniref:Lysine--tRNA ligase n=1 Tax=Roseinatronobacter domitianus TaxID=2940293 RepID=A0ABT0LXK4_9RHOB|nr:lysine--tRNA ligase [Roseibaca domitiana]MCL1627333.1 lysine--tRNA ligase [Roseibaca domitiana]
MSSLRDAALSSKAWPFEEARKLAARYKDGPPAKGHVLFETGYGPSGLPHIGTFGEVARTTMIRRAFETISDIPTRMICFSDDMDGMRKVPDNVPDPAALATHLQKPLTAVPDPFGTHDSFGAHNNAMLRRFLDTFGFDYEFISATEYYTSGQFDPVLLRAAERYDDLMAVMLKSLREERQQTYSIFLPIHPETGRVLYVPMKHVDGAKGEITFDDEHGREWTLPVTGGQVKLQWKPDFGARWAGLGVDFEMYGKDHAANTPIYDRICEILGGRKPEHYIYELFLDEQGEKISKSKGNGISIDEWLKYASTESLSYYMFLKPRTAKRLSWDVIPKAVDEYHQQLRAFPGQTPDQQAANPVWHIHGGQVPASGMVVSFSLLLNLASVARAQDKDTLWGFIRRYAPEAAPETHPDLDQAAGFAVRYFADFVAPTLHPRAPDAAERAALVDLSATLAQMAQTGAVPAAHAAEYDSFSEELFMSVVRDTGKAHGFDNLRAWFKVLYEVLLGSDQGPRWGSFIALYGLSETVTLIDRALAGELAA